MEPSESNEYMERPYSKGADSTEFGANTGDTSDHVKRLSPKLNPQTSLAIAISVLLASSGAVLLQMRQPSSYSAGPSWDWFIKPIQFHSAAGLPTITSDIHSVEVQPGNRRVWIVGTTGLLAFSSDEGRSWTKLRYESDQRSFRIPSKTSVRAVSSPAVFLSLVRSRAGFRAGRTTIFRLRHRHRTQGNLCRCPATVRRSSAISSRSSRR